MESSNRKSYLISLGLWLICLTGWAQNKEVLVPNAVIIQHAGSIGYVSAGVGYDLFKDKAGNLELFYGYVPEEKAGELHVLTAKFAYRPLKFPIGKNLTVYPINPGVFFAYTFGENISFSFDKQQYSRGYYGWSEALRSHISVNNELELHNARSVLGRRIKALSLYSEWNASDLYLVSWATNIDGLPFFEIVKLGIGVRLKF